MKIRFYGTRGSIPSPSIDGEFSTAKYGGNTTCVYFEATDGTKHILDAGSGIRPLGIQLAREKKASGRNSDLNLYISHTHWDHIQGFPFFVPAYDPTNAVRIYGERKVKSGLVEARMSQSEPPVNRNGVSTESVLADQQKPENFPAPLVAMKGIKEINDITAGQTVYDTPTLKVEALAVNHPGGCLSYRVTETNAGVKRTFVYCTDFEPDNNGEDDRLVEWWGGAELVIADAQYEVGSVENPFMKGWGHSDYVTDVNMALRSKVRRLALTHHEPKMDDNYHEGLEQRARGYAQQKTSDLEVVLAREGLELGW